MSTVRWKLIKALQCEFTYGYITKTKRLELGLPKSHYHDAFIIAGGTTQPRAKPLFMEQIRRNNRVLQKFYDAKYIDRRTGEKATGKALNNGRRTRNKSLNTENLRKYRGKKISKGRVSVRRQRYPYQPKDIVKYQGQSYMVKGMQNYGAYVKLAEFGKLVRTSLISPIKFRKGICIII